MCGYDSNATTQASAVFCRTTIQPHTPLYILYKFLSPIQFELKLQFCSFTNQKFNTSHSIMVLNVVSRHHSEFKSTKCKNVHMNKTNHKQNFEG